MLVEARAAEGVAHLVVRAAGGDAGRQGDRAECLGQSLDGGQPGVHRLAVALFEQLTPVVGRLVADPGGDVLADGGAGAPDEAVHDLVLGQRPAQLRSQRDLEGQCDAFGVDEYPVAVEYHQFNRLDHARSIEAAPVRQGVTMAKSGSGESR